MILADTSIWVDHLRHSDATLASRLQAHEILTHPWVIGELAVGVLRQRSKILRLLSALPKAIIAREDEVLKLIDERELAGTGIGYVDAHLLASTLLTPDARLWTRDGRLSKQAIRLGLSAESRITRAETRPPNTTDLISEDRGD